MTARQNFDKALNELENEILRMGSMVERAIYDAVESLAKQDVDLAQRVINGDRDINYLETEIEDRLVTLIATQQPIARDLRRIITGIKIITNLERMGDHAVDIARVTKRIAGQPLIKPLVDIPRMAKISQQMVKEGLDAYVRSDVDKAKYMCSLDDEVDHLYSQVFRELLTYMMEDPKTIAQATSLLFVARFLERIADYATNIGEAVIYLVTGERFDLNL
ncbi:MULTISPECIES: phosphate signaling complex protein PhoU [Carboxydothermus]|uniref:Phosphate-specific transport system accessory protein PhoU n=2 Tax=Carboxydothermus TaxID=129957 RepID=Q3AAH0_CARHZ|nr:MULTISPECIES: phosphate signaling complex protein PhoU [Carboxydothermus]ABB14326.1 phosphate transport system regulatory protein PhoU [Carboxydothermus hydrogenoformans Z-2901]NYE58758.1 phosphate transport system protein [Carboxydothermus ferrireducens DSM 11255]